MEPSTEIIGYLVGISVIWLELRSFVWDFGYLAGILVIRSETGNPGIH